MESWIVGAICTVVQLIITTVVGLIINKLWNKRQANEREFIRLQNEEQRRQRKEDVLACVKELLLPIEERLDRVEKQILDNNEGTCAGLRHHLLTFFYSCLEKGYRTQDDTENFTDMYEAYVKLGGNSFIQKDVSKWFYELPLKEQFKGDK